jgi:hypothetical protein
VRVSQIPDGFINLAINTKKLDNYGFLPDQTRNKIEKSHKVHILLFTQEFLDIYYNVPIQYALEKHQKSINQNEMNDSLLPKNKCADETQNCQVS